MSVLSVQILPWSSLFITCIWPDILTILSGLLLSDISLGKAVFSFFTHKEQTQQVDWSIYPGLYRKSDRARTWLQVSGVAAWSGSICCHLLTAPSTVFQEWVKKPHFSYGTEIQWTENNSKTDTGCWLKSLWDSFARILSYSVFLIVFSLLARTCIRCLKLYYVG